MNYQQKLSWVNNVLLTLKVGGNINFDSFIFFVGKTYCRDLVQYLQNYSLPLEG